MSQENFDFSTVEAAVSAEFMVPGYWNVKITDVAFIDKKDDGSAITPRVKITFAGKGGQFSDNFFITPKAMPRLQYLHEQWIGKKLEKVFENATGVYAYFEKLFKSPQAQKISKMIIVGGETVGDKTYARLPYTGFVLPDEGNFKEEAFEVGSNLWKNHVTVKTNASTATNDVMLPGNDAPPSGNSPKEEESDLPF